MAINIEVFRMIYLDGVQQTGVGGSSGDSVNTDSAYMDTYTGLSSDYFTLYLSVLSDAATTSFSNVLDTSKHTCEGVYLDRTFTTQLSIGNNTISQNNLISYSDSLFYIYIYENWITNSDSTEEEETTSISTTDILVVGHADVTHTFYAYPESGSSYLQYVTDEDTGEVCLRFKATAPALYVSLSNVDTALYKNQGFYLDSAHTISYITNGKVSGDLLPYLVNIEDENSYWQTTYPNQTHILYIYEDWALIESEDNSSNGSTDNNDDNSTGDETTDNSSSTTKTVPVCFKIGAVDYSMYVNELKVVSTATYNKQTNANGDSFVDYINHKRTIEVGIIPLNNTIMALLLNDIDRFSVSLTFLNPQTGELETDVRCIIPKSNVEYYTIQSNKISFKAFSLSFIEL